MPVSFAYLFYSKEILMLLFDDRSAELGAPLLAVLSSSVVSLSILTVVNSILEAAMHQKIPLIAMGVGAVLKVVCGYIFIGRFGIIGAPLSTGICYCISLIISVAYMSFVLNVDIGLPRIFCTLFILSFLSVGTTYYVYNYFAGGIYNMTLFLVFSGISVLLYSILVCIFMRKKLFDVFKFVKIAKK